jgi:L-ascorbate metabolism protein UlaG (beta-lactamase superfamily)
MHKLLGGNNVYYPGHSTFSIITSAGENIIIDPWLADNPKTPEELREQLSRIHNDATVYAMHPGEELVSHQAS